MFMFNSRLMFFPIDIVLDVAVNYVTYLPKWKNGVLSKFSQQTESFKNLIRESKKQNKVKKTNRALNSSISTIMLFSEIDLGEK